MLVPDAPCTLLARIKRADASVFYCLLRPARAGALIRRSAPKRSALKRKIARQIHRDSPPQRRLMPFYKTINYTALAYMCISLCPNRWCRWTILIRQAPICRMDCDFDFYRIALGGKRIGRRINNSLSRRFLRFKQAVYQTDNRKEK